MTGKPLAKRDFLERLDKALEPLLDAGVVIAVGADHTTNSNTGAHSAEPVPALINQPGADPDFEPVKFGEVSCAEGNMERQISHEFLLRVLHTMGYPVAMSLDAFALFRLWLNDDLDQYPRGLCMACLHSCHITVIFDL